MSISLICACKNRYNALIVSLNSWLQFKEITEIIVVDWSSDDPIDHITRIDPRIKVITVPNKKYFNQPQPLNLAASIATGDYILKLDSDYILNPYYDFVTKYRPEENNFTSGRISYTSPEYYNPDIGAYVIDKDNMSLDDLDVYFNTYSPFYKYLTGLLFVKREYYNKIGGYNENLNSCYAYEDGEICDRLKLLGLNENNIDYDTNIIHIPHPNKKRTENFIGFPDQENYEAMVRANLEQSYSGDQLEWQLEYAIAQKHIEHNKNTVGEIKEYYTKPKTKWDITQKDPQNYVAIELDNNKLSGFPSVYYVSLEECVDRRGDLEKQFEEYNIKPNAIISKRYSESNDIITGKYVNTLNGGTKGCCVSHLKAIKKWYEETNEDYGFFCEDDLSLETIEHWDFTWKEFINSIPDEIECVQLFSIRKEYDTFEMRPRHWDDWGATAYIMKRGYAKKIINTFIQDQTFNLEIPNNDVMPLIETILFSSVGESYTFPIFVENIKFDSTFVGSDDDVKNGQKTNHRIAKDLILNYWKNKNNSVMIEKTVLENLLMDYSLDTENPENNFNLGLWYETEGHTAPALSYYLRCAERASESNPDLAYEALIRGSFCYEKQGTRDGSSRSLLFQAQAFRTDRPEAYFLLSAFAQKREWWQDCYLNADLALRYCNFNCAPLKTDVKYPGKFGLLYQKAIGGWWWGKVSESRSLLTDILNNYDLNEVDYKFISDNLKNIGGDIPHIIQEENQFDYPESFDWSELTYEDKITIEREIVHEKVYRFWKDVKENDVVVDIGASVGAYCISILDQKPKTVYCVEPSKKLLKSLLNNCSEKIFDFDENPLVLVNKAIVENQQDKVNIFGGDEEYSTITFKNFIDKNSIDHINFMKIDCEGGEYNIFNDDNIDFLINNVDFIAMETHLNYDGCREKFKKFRDNYLVKFNNYKIMSCTRQNISWGESIDLKDNLFDDSFVDSYTCEFMIYIYNR